MNLHKLGDAEQMFQTLIFNTFGSSTRVKWGISRKYNNTALSRRHCRLHSNFILSFASQSTLLKTPVQPFPTTYEAVTDTFMLVTIYRNTTPPFLRPHTSINSRYTTICKFQNGVTIRVTNKNVLYWIVFGNSFTIYV